MRFENPELGLSREVSVEVEPGDLKTVAVSLLMGLLLAGITLMIGLQAIVNISVVTSVVPNKGLPLPFISYGGSNLLVMLTGIGLLLSIARHAQTTAGSLPTATPTAEAESPEFA